jgi:hypothetical protein
MYSVRARSLRWTGTVALTVILGALFVVRALAGGQSSSHQFRPETLPQPARSAQGESARDLVLSHSVVSGKSTNTTFGPVGANCDATTAGPDCTFVTLNTTATGKSEPGGPFTETDTVTILIGLFSAGGPFVYQNGAVDSNGNESGGCVQTFGVAHRVYANGTIDLNTQGASCCASDTCANFIAGPPGTSHGTAVCTSGTGKYAGIQCSEEASGGSTDGVHFVSRGEMVSTKQQ